MIGHWTAGHFLFFSRVLRRTPFPPKNDSSEPLLHTTDMYSLPSEMLREIASHIGPAEVYLLRETAKMFGWLPPPEETVNLIHRGAKHGSAALCEMGITRDHNPLGAALIAVKYGHKHILEWVTEVSDHRPKCTIRKAIKIRDYDTVRWLMDAGYPMTHSAVLTALAHAPAELILEMISRVAYGTRKNPDYDRMLRFAVKYGRLDVLGSLADRGWPLGGCVAEWAASHDQPEIFKWIWPGNIGDNIDTLLSVARKSRSLEIYTLLTTLRPEEDPGLYEILSARGDAARIYELSGLVPGPHVDSSSAPNPSYIPPWDASAVFAAAEHGHIELVKFLAGPLLERGLKTHAWPTHARPGTLDVLIWLAEHNVKCDPTRCYNLALASGDLEAVEWIVGHYGQLISIAPESMYNTTIRGHTQILQYLAARGKIHSNTLMGVLHIDKRKSTQITERILSYGVKPTSAMYFCAIDFKDFDLLKRLHMAGPPLLSIFHYRSAIAHGSIAMLKWIAEIGTDVPYCIYVTAMRRGNIPVVKFLVDQGHAWDPTAWVRAAKRGHLNVLKWVHARGLTMSLEPETAGRVLERSPKHVRAWIHENILGGSS